MNQQEFMRRLEELLEGISREERKEALDYYRNYFEDAGVENEQKVIRELESPEKLAESIKEGLQENVTAVVEAQQTDSESMGESETAGDDSYAATPKEAAKPANDNTALIVTLVVVAVVTSPIWIGFIGSICGICIGILAALFGLALGGVVGGFACIGVGITFFVVADVSSGLFVLGISGMLLAVGILSLLLLVLVCGKLIPWMIRGIVSLIGKLFHKERKEQRA